LADDRVALVKQVKEANDIVAVVGSYVALHPVGPTFKGLCPFHDDQRPSFDVDPRRQRYRCWSCGKYGDVFTFVQEHERLSFPEALEILARRAGIQLDTKGTSPEARRRALLLDTVAWAVEQYQACLHDAPEAEGARRYLDERGLTEETTLRFAVGFAPLEGDWLVKCARRDGVSAELLEKVGLLLPRHSGNGYFDRFRERVMFPIRDARGRAVGFGGRILPGSPYEKRVGKYINTTGTELFTKGELLYGLDQARLAADKSGYLAVVEGYTDVLMAHQMGVAQVVATMGTALTSRHVRELRRFAPRVVLVFDADAGGSTGVDRALEIFAGEDVDLAVAALPEGLDPCDLLVQQGPEPFKAALVGATDALDFKLTEVLTKEEARGVAGRERAVEVVLSIIALAPEMPGQAGAVRQELMVTRIAQRVGLKEETVWGRLREMRARKRRADERRGEEPPPQKRAGRAPAEENELLQVLLAEPSLVSVAAAGLSLDEVQHPEVRRILGGMYRLQAAGEMPELDVLRLQLAIDDAALASYLLRLRDLGRLHADRSAWLDKLLAAFRKRREVTKTQELQNQLHAVHDHAEAVALLRQLQQTVSSEPGAAEAAARS
jgi:DNA primase